jgi:hypothetical protein
MVRFVVYFWNSIVTSRNNISEVLTTDAFLIKPCSLITVNRDDIGGQGRLSDGAPACPSVGAAPPVTSN